MNKTRKGLLTASSILTIVAGGFAILFSVIIFFVGGMFTEKFFKEEYLNDKTITYVEKANGDYYFMAIDEEGEILTIYKKDLQLVAKLMKTVSFVSGGVGLVFATTKIVLAIRILLVTSREKYANGSVIALLVLSIMGMNLLESGLLITVMCMKDKNNNEKLLSLDDIDVENNTINNKEE